MLFIKETHNNAITAVFIIPEILALTTKYQIINRKVLKVLFFSASVTTIFIMVVL